MNELFRIIHCRLLSDRSQLRRQNDEMFWRNRFIIIYVFLLVECEIIVNVSESVGLCMAMCRSDGDITCCSINSRSSWHNVIVDKHHHRYYLHHLYRLLQTKIRCQMHRYQFFILLYDLTVIAWWLVIERHGGLLPPLVHTKNHHRIKLWPEIPERFPHSGSSQLQEGEIAKTGTDKQGGRVEKEENDCCS